MTELGVGRPLESATRTRFEGATGDDLSGTRIHDDGIGARASSTAGARALAIGPHIAFANGAYAPGTIAGDALLAHELAHTQQQANTDASMTSAPTVAAEVNADRAAGGILARLAGRRVARPRFTPVRGFSLQRCKMGYDPEFDYKMGETKQQTWMRVFRRDHPELENVGAVKGIRDEGIMTEMGIRVPKVPGHLLAPRKFYERWMAQFFVYQGFIHYAELAEVMTNPAAYKQAASLYSRTGKQIPNDLELDLVKYTNWQYNAMAAKEGVQAGLMIADAYMVARNIAANLRRPPSGVTTGEITVKPVTPTTEPPPQPKVIVEPEPPPRVTVEPPPKVTVEPEAPPKVTVEPEAPPKVTVEPEPPPKVTAEQPSVKPKTPKTGYTGEWPPPDPGPRPTNATAQEMADWRYKRYARDAFEKGTPPEKILTPEGYKPYANVADKPGARPGRGGGSAQQATRKGPAQAEGFENTETTQLGSRKNPRTGETEANMVDGKRSNKNGGTDYLEVDDINKNGLPRSEMRTKLKSEIEALKPGDTLEYWDKKDPSRRIRYQYGEDPSVVDTRKGPTLPRKPRAPK